MITTNFSIVGSAALRLCHPSKKVFIKSVKKMLKASGVSTKPPREGGAQLGYNPWVCSPNVKTLPIQG